MEDRKKRYAKKLVQIKVSLIKGKDDKYIEFLKSCPNKTEFIRQAIECELKKYI